MSTNSSFDRGLVLIIGTKYTYKAFGAGVQCVTLAVGNRHQRMFIVSDVSANIAVAIFRVNGVWNICRKVWQLSTFEAACCRKSTAHVRIRCSLKG
jgi:hypothetical protein